MSTYAGTVALARLALRRDRVLVPVTAVLLVALAGGSASATVALYPEPAAALAAARAVVASPAVLAMYGPIDATNPDSIAAFKTLTIGAMLVAALAVTLVTRHTRADEEAGRTELLGAGAIGRRAPLTAAVLLATAVVAAVSLAAGLSMASAGLGLRGSLAFSAAWATTGVAFVGVTAVAAQVAGTARGCAGLAYAVLGGAYLVRAVGDTTPLHWLVWVSPVGWAQEVGAFGDDRVGVLLLGVTWSAALVAVAVGLLERRDLGAGLLPTRPGPVVAAASLRTPLALAWRLQRGLLLGWVVAYGVLGVVLGAVAGSADSFVTDDSVRQVLEQLGGSASSLADVFVGVELHLLAIGAAAYGLAAALRLHSEEVEQHAEQLIATGVTRRALLVSHATVSLGGSALLLLVVGTGLATTTSGGPGTALSRLLPAALAPVSAVWVSCGLALLLYAALPRATVAAWALLAVFLVLGELGPLLRVPQPVIGLSPFVHVSPPPGGTVPTTPIGLLLLFAGGLCLAADGAFRRRDLVNG